MLEAALARIAGAYAPRAYLPASLAARTFRNTLRRLRGKAGAPVTRLPQVAWLELLKSRPIELTETAKSDGNVRLSELAILALAACEAAPGSCTAIPRPMTGRPMSAGQGWSLSTARMPTTTRKRIPKPPCG